MNFEMQVQACVMFDVSPRLHDLIMHAEHVSLVPRPFPAPVLIACSIKTEGKAWEKESRA